MVRISKALGWEPPTSPSRRAHGHYVLAVALRKVERARASGDNDLLCSFVGPRVRGQNLPSAISDTSKARGRSPRTVASATIQDRS